MSAIRPLKLGPVRSIPLVGGLWELRQSRAFLGLVALALTFALLQVPWNYFWTIFLLITILAFIPEFFGLQYIGPVANNSQGAER